MKIDNFKEKLLLVSAALVWGSSYPLSKVAFNYMGTLTMISLRFLIGSIIVGIFFYKNLKTTKKSTLKNGIIIGFFLFLGMYFATYGIEYTTASNAGFLSCLHIVFIPFLSFILYKKKISKKEMAGSLITLAGVPLLTLTSLTNFSANYGDILCLIGSVMFALMIIFSDKFAKEEDPIVLGIIELFTVGILSSILAIKFENYEVILNLKSLVVILSLACFCTAYCYVTLLYTQKKVNSVEAGLILTFEPLFAVLFSFLFLGEILSFKASIGAILIMFGIIFGGVL
ncbi:MAG: DMT family transporter [Fusobacterium sp.]|nr:DMT family transporter [Fusobacterium sp.]